jgi:hypothetical protein
MILLMFEQSSYWGIAMDPHRYSSKAAPRVWAIRAVTPKEAEVE